MASQSSALSTNKERAGESLLKARNGFFAEGDAAY